jgi:hypothetical protein
MTDEKKFAYELEELGVSEAQYNKQKAELLVESKQQLKFVARESSVIDKKIMKILRMLKIEDVPVVPLKERLYFVGMHKVMLQMKGDFLMVQVGDN